MTAETERLSKMYEIPSLRIEVSVSSFNWARSVVGLFSMNAVKLRKDNVGSIKKTYMQ